MATEEVQLPDASLELLMSLAGWTFPLPRGNAMDSRYITAPNGLRYAVQRRRGMTAAQDAFRLFLQRTSNGN